MLSKSELIKGKYYIGHCRNASYARWSGKRFFYWRTKFDDTFIEGIYHPDDDNHFDVFVPEQLIKDIPCSGL